jgi:hypothetical protein
MIENWDVAPWVIAVIGGPVVLAVAFVAVMARRRGRRSDGPPRGRSPDYSDPSQNR